MFALLKEYAEHDSLFHDLRVGHSLLPLDAKNPSETSHI